MGRDQWLMANWGISGEIFREFLSLTPVKSRRRKRNSSRQQTILLGELLDASIDGPAYAPITAKIRDGPVIEIVFWGMKHTNYS